MNRRAEVDAWFHSPEHLLKGPRWSGTPGAIHSPQGGVTGTLGATVGMFPRRTSGRLWGTSSGPPPKSDLSDGGFGGYSPPMSPHPGVRARDSAETFRWHGGLRSAVKFAGFEP